MTVQGAGKGSGKLTRIELPEHPVAQANVGIGIGGPVDAIGEKAQQFPQVVKTIL